jgi:hypothetical protein
LAPWVQSVAGSGLQPRSAARITAKKTTKEKPRPGEGRGAFLEGALQGLWGEAPSTVSAPAKRTASDSRSAWTKIFLISKLRQLRNICCDAAVLLERLILRAFGRYPRPRPRLSLYGRLAG